MPRIQLGGVAADPDALAVGESTHPRNFPFIATSTTSGVLRLTYFTARKTEQVGSIRMSTGSTPAAATPTLVRMGVYSVAANGDLTLMGATANDTTLFAGANATSTRAVTVPFTKFAGQRYAVGMVIVTAATAPTIVCSGATPLASENALSPKLAAQVGGQTDLPASVLSGGISAYAVSIYAAVTP